MCKMSKLKTICLPRPLVRSCAHLLPRVPVQLAILTSTNGANAVVTQVALAPYGVMRATFACFASQPKEEVIRSVFAHSQESLAFER